MKATPARLDADGKAKPLSRLIDHRNPGHCFGPGMSLNRPEYEDQDGERTPLTPTQIIVIGDDDPDVEILPSNAGETSALYLDEAEKDLLRRVLVKTFLLMPFDKDVAQGLLEKLR